jgi:hypothetical protein
MDNFLSQTFFWQETFLLLTLRATLIECVNQDMILIMVFFGEESCYCFRWSFRNKILLAPQTYRTKQLNCCPAYVPNYEECQRGTYD